MSNDVKISIRYSAIPLKYVGDTGVKTIPCTVTDMIDQGVQICDGRFSNEACWEGEGVIISPAITDGTRKVYGFTAPELSPANNKYIGGLLIDFRERDQPKTAQIVVHRAPRSV